MEDIIIKVVIYSAIGVMFQVAEPIIRLKRQLGFKEESKDTGIKDIIKTGLYCAMCSTFHIMFWIEHDFSIYGLGLACVAAIVSEFLIRRLNKH